MPNIQLDLCLDLDYDKEEQEKPEFQKRLKVYQLKYGKRFKVIKYSLFILQSVNVLILWSCLYWDFISKLIPKTQTRQKVYNLSMSKSIGTALLGIFVLIIANFILLCLILLSTPCANFLITLRKEYNNGYFSSSISGGPSEYNGKSDNQSTGPPNSI